MLMKMLTCHRFKYNALYNIVICVITVVKGIYTLPMCMKYIFKWLILSTVMICKNFCEFVNNCEDL